MNKTPKETAEFIKALKENAIKHRQRLLLVFLVSIPAAVGACGTNIKVALRMCIGKTAALIPGNSRGMPAKREFNTLS